MKFLKNAFDLYISSSIHVSLAITCFALISILQFGLPVNPEFLAFIFFGTITSYNFVKYAGIAQLYHLSLVRNLRIIQIFSFFCFLALVYFIFQQDLKTLIGAGCFGMLTLLYAVPIFKGRNNLRDLKGVKVFVIALTATGVSVVLPVLDQAGVLLQDVIVEFIQRFLLILVVMIPFEIRDLKYDQPELFTIPQVLGVKKSKLLGYSLLILGLLLELFSAEFKMVNLLGLLFISSIIAFFLGKSREMQPKYFASFWVEAVPMFWVGIWLLLNYAYR